MVNKMQRASRGQDKLRAWSETESKEGFKCRELRNLLKKMFILKHHKCALGFGNVKLRV